MATKTWNVHTADGDHEVALDWGYWGGRRVLSVDGEVVDRSTVPLRFLSTQKFELDGHECAVTTKPSHAVSPFFVIELTMDGEPVATDDKRDTWESAKSA